MAARMYPDLAARSEPKPAEAPTTEDTVAARMYPAEPPAAPAEPEAVTVDELVSRELSAAEALYSQGGHVPETPEAYSTVLGERFDQFEQQARYDRNEEDVQSLAEGRREAAALMHELQVPREEARELTQTLGDWVTKPALDENANWDNKIKSLRSLEEEWGRETQARVQLAQRTAEEACKRMPWLADLLASGAGNDPKVIKRFAEIGLRQARKGRQRG